MWKMLLRPEQDRDVLSESKLRHPPVQGKVFVHQIQVHDRCIAWRTRTTMTSRTWVSKHDRKWEEFGVLEGKNTKECFESGRKLKKWKGANEGFENCLEYVTEAKEAHATHKESHTHSPEKKKKKKKEKSKMEASSSQKCLKIIKMEASLSQKCLRIIKMEASLSQKCLRIIKIEASLSQKCLRIIKMEASPSQKCLRIIKMEASPS